MSAANPGYTLGAGATWAPGKMLAGSGGTYPPLAGASGVTGNLRMNPAEVVFDGSGNILDADSDDDTVDLVAESPTNPGWVLPTGDVWMPGDVYPIAGYQEADYASGTPQDSNNLDIEPEGLLVGSPGQLLMLDNESETLVGTYAPAQPTVTVAPGDTSLTLSWPANPASDRVVSYSYSTDGGTTWTAATPTVFGSTDTQTITGLTNGTTYPIEVEAASDFGTTASVAVNGTPSTVAPTAITGMAGTLTVGTSYGGNGVVYQVKVRAINRIGHGPASDSKNVIPNAPALRTVRHPPASEVAIPSDPQLYNGPQVYTRALDTSHNRTWAHPIDTLGARQLTVGEAATLSNSGLFDFNSGVLSAAGRADVKSLAGHLRLAHAVRCEGYTDYAGESSHEMSLSEARAQAVCEALVQDGAHVRFVTHGYGRGPPRRHRRHGGLAGREPASGRACHALIATAGAS